MTQSLTTCVLSSIICNDVLEIIVDYSYCPKVRLVCRQFLMWYDKHIMVVARVRYLSAGRLVGIFAVNDYLAARYVCNHRTIDFDTLILCARAFTFSPVDMILYADLMRGKSIKYAPEPMVELIHTCAKAHNPIPLLTPLCSSMWYGWHSTPRQTKMEGRDKGIIHRLLNLMRPDIKYRSHIDSIRAACYNRVRRRLAKKILSGWFNISKFRVR